MFSSSVHSLGEQSTWDSNNVRQLLKIPDDQLKIIANLPGKLPDSAPSLGTSSVSSPISTAAQVISNGLPHTEKLVEKGSNTCEHNSNNFENTKHLKSVEGDEINNAEKNMVKEDETTKSVNILKDRIVNSQDDINVKISSSNSEQGSEAYLNDKHEAHIDAQAISLNNNLNESSNSQPIPCGQPVVVSSLPQLENEPVAEKNASSQNISTLDIQVKVYTEPSQDCVSHSHKMNSQAECSDIKKDQDLPTKQGTSLNNNLDESNNSQPIPCGQPVITSNLPQLKNELKNISSENVLNSDPDNKDDAGIPQNCILHSHKINNPFMLSEYSDKREDQNLEAKQKRLGRKRKMAHNKESKAPQSKIAKRFDIHFTPDQVRNIIDVMKLFFPQ